MSRDLHVYCELCGPYRAWFPPEAAVTLEGAQPVTLCPTCIEQGCPACTSDLADATDVVLDKRTNRVWHRDCLAGAVDHAEREERAR